MAAVANNLRLPANVQAVVFPPGTQWTCSVSRWCDGDLLFPPAEPKHTPFLIDGTHYCVECLQGFFQSAMDDESSWPTNIRNRTININDFAGFLDPAFVARYNAQEAIYNTGATHMRVYCPHIQGNAGPCQTFLGARLTETGAAQWQQCIACGGTVCMICSGPQPTSGTEHVCDREHVDFLEMLRNGQDRGYAYQICPRCTRVVQQSEEGLCNHMR